MQFPSCLLAVVVAPLLLLQSVAVSSFITSNQQQQQQQSFSTSWCSRQGRQQQTGANNNGDDRNILLQLQAVSNNNNKQGQSGGENIEKFAVSSSRGSKAIKASKIRNSDKPNGWESFKSAIYGTVDGVESISDKIKGGSEDPGVQGGYSSIEKSIYSNNASPGQRLMNEYRSRSSPSSLKSSGQSTTTSSTEKEPTSAFDSFKGVVYDSVDVASQVFSGDSNDKDSSLQSFKPLVQPTLSSSEIQKTLPDLQSNNPITRKIAEGKIKNWEDKEKKRQRDLEREEAAQKFKESVYQIGDAVVASAGVLSTVPSKLSVAAEKTGKIAKKVKKQVETVPGKMDEVVTSVNAIPNQVKARSDRVQNSVKQSVETTKNSVKQSVETTKKAVDEVKTIPTKIETSVKDTQQKVNAAVTAVDEVATNIKVFAGLEKPKPKPPKTPPPPPPTAGEYSRKIAGSVVTGVATGTAKLAWWAGKGAAVAAWNGVQSATGNAKADQVKPSVAFSSTTGDKDQSASANASEDDPTSPTSDSDVDMEVQEALRLAQSAIDFADKNVDDESMNKKK